MKAEKYYFQDEDSEHCYTKDYFIREMEETGLKEMKVLEAVKGGVDKDFIWCKETDTCGEKSECGRMCDDYKPRNGKNGICIHRGILYSYSYGKEVILTK